MHWDLTTICGGTLCAFLILLEVTIIAKIWNNTIDLSQLISETNGGASLSRFQFLVFTFVIALCLFLVVVGSGGAPAFPNIPPGIFALLGISAGSYVVSKGIQFSNPAGIEDGPSVQVAPQLAPITAPQQQVQFKASVPGGASQSVSWTIDPKTGSIDLQTGLYTGPAALPAAKTTNVLVTAASRRRRNGQRNRCHHHQQPGGNGSRLTPMANPTAQTPLQRATRNKAALAGVAFAVLGGTLSTLPRTASAPGNTPIGANAPAMCEPDPADFMQCHDNFPTGCSQSEHPNYDAYLNDLKNLRGPFLGEDNPVVLGKPDYARLESQTPPNLDSRNHVTFKDALTTLGEGQARAVIGYLYYEEVTGAETSNCQLTGDPNVDYHIGIGFQKPDRTLPNSGPPTKADEQSSVVVEMTPHTRAEINPKWTSAALEANRGKMVKVVGQLLVDNEHNNVKDNCGLSGAKATCWRLSVCRCTP